MSVLSKLYSRIFWKNYPSVDTCIDEVHLNRMDAGIDAIDDRLIQIDTTKFDKTSANGLITGFELNAETGDVTLTYFSGSKTVIHTNLAKVALNITYDPVNERLVLHMPDGTDTYVDMKALITQFEFLESDTIAFEVTADGKVKANIKKGSITEDMLQPNYLADIKVEASKAQSSAAQASEYETRAAYDAQLAQSYAVGGSGIREGEDSDNAKVYKEQAATSEANAASSASTASTAAHTATERAAAAKASETNAGTSATTAANAAQTATEQATAASQSSASAAASAQTATEQAVAASTSAGQAYGYADMAKSYAVGTEGAVREGDGSDNAKYYKEQAERIAEGLKGSLLPMGTITFAELPDTSKSGYMYNISDEFTTTDRFKEGAGHVVPAGTNVYYTADGYWDCMAGSPVTSVNGQRGNVDITPETIGLGKVPNVPTNDQTPTYTAAASIAALVSGEKLSVAFGKIAKAISLLISHIADTVIHHTHSNKTTLDATTAAYTTEEKTKLSGIAAGAQVNTITGVKGSAESSYRTGNVNITAANIGLGNVNNTADADKSVNYASSAGKVQTQSHDSIYLNSNWNGSCFVTNAKATDGVTFPIWVNNAGVATSAELLKTTDPVAYDTTSEAWGFISEFFDKNGVRVGWINRYYKGDGTVDLYIDADKGKVILNNGYVRYASDAGNADTLDGYHASAFAAASHTHAYLPLSGGTVTGGINFNGRGTIDGAQFAVNGVLIYGLLINGAGIVKFNSCDVQARVFSSNDTKMGDGFVKTTHNGGWLNLQANNQIQCRNYDDNAWVPIAASGYPGPSSRRYKKNVEDMTDDVAKSLLKYRVVSYDYINEANGTNCLGLIAEEVAKICEWPVFRNADGEPDGLDYSRFVPQLIKMVQLQQEQIDNLERQLQKITE